MFTGIIETTGKLTSMTPGAGGDYRLMVQTGDLDLSDVRIGDSIAVNGACLTATDIHASGFSADVSVETLDNTTLGDLRPGAVLNLEKSLTPSSRLGGHLVSGHVDGVGEVTEIRSEARSWHIEVRAPDELARYIARKGSITADGISLTVNEVTGARFALNIVPHTWDVTNMAHWQTGTRMNLEVDIIARYLERLLLGDKAAQPDAGESISMAFLAEHGFLGDA
jgi:riboflavin synthase